jgi:DNA-directed RNA polymerase specialized sigma24 family protein
MEPAELHGAGKVALYEALRTFRAERHPSFEWYAEIHVRGRLLDALIAEASTPGEQVELIMERAGLRQAEHQVLHVDLMRDPSTNLKEGMRRRLGERLAAGVAMVLIEAQRPTPEEDLGARQERALADEAYEGVLDEVDPGLLAAVLLVHRDGKTLEAAGQELGIHKSTAQRRVAKGVLEIRAAMKARGIQNAPAPLDFDVLRARNSPQRPQRRHTMRR